MKSLWKISRRYIWSAILLTLLVCVINLALLLYFGFISVNGIEQKEMGRTLMDEIVEELSCGDGGWELSETGYEKLQKSSFLWAMLLSEDGSVVWSYELPEELPLHYSVGDIAAFSRWYLMDYPVRVWRNGDGLMVFGMEKRSIVKIQAVYDREVLDRLPVLMKSLLIVNAAILIGLALLMAYRFYRSLKPIARGIESLEGKQVLVLPEKGLMGDLAVKLNKTSALLRWQDEKLSKRDRARTEWIAGVSHDIRTPLALITGYADELAADKSLGEEQQKKAGVIRRQSLVIGQLISDLNLTSKLEYQSQPLQRQPFSPAGLLRECVAEYYNDGLPENYDIELKINEGVEGSCYEGDTALLLRCFRNLIGNSLRHNPQGADILIELSKKQDGVHLFFADTGGGIPEEVVRVLSGSENFSEEKNREKRQRLSTAENAETAGTVETGERVSETTGSVKTGKTVSETAGTVHVMGLRIAKQIVEAHGFAFCLKKRTQGGYDVEIVLKMAK